MTEVCSECRRGYTQSAPEKWIQKYKALGGLCPDCVSRWIIANVPEER